MLVLSKRLLGIKWPTAVVWMVLLLQGCGGSGTSNSASGQSFSSETLSSVSSSLLSSSAASVVSSRSALSSSISSSPRLSSSPSSISSSSLSSVDQKSSSFSSSSSLARLRLSGQQIVTPSGSAIVLRGWNWGRWGIVQPTDAMDNRAQGANVVRIPLRWWGYYAGTNIDSRDDSQVATAGINPKHLAILDSTIAQANAAGLWIDLFIDSDCGQNGLQDIPTAEYCDPDAKYPEGHNFWTDNAMRQKYIAVWKFIAERYKDTPYLGMFEPLPEPDPLSASDEEISSFYSEITSVIRSIAPGVPLVVGPRAYQMKSAAKAYNPAWTDVIYTANLFLHTGGTQSENIENLKIRLQELEDVRASYGVPIFVQQAGVLTGDDPELIYINALLSLLNSHSVGYTYWSYRDTLNPNAYGIIYQDGQGGWITKKSFLDTISFYLKEK